MYTSHGHQIIGTTVTEPRPPVARCGGPGLCAQCSKEAQAAPKVAVGTPVESGTFRKKPIDVRATRWFRNGDHPDDKVGQLVVDWVKLVDLHPELLNIDYPIKETIVDGQVVIINERTGEIRVDAPPVYAAIEGRVVRFFRRSEEEYAGDKFHLACKHRWHDHGWIETLEGGHIVCPGDWICTGVRGEHWPVKPDIFVETYERVGDL